MSIIRTSNNYTCPKQKIPKSKKTKEWAANSARYYRDACEPALDTAEALKLHRLANGELDQEDYMYVTNPINSNKPELQGYPARLMNYDIISPIVSLLMGEKVRRQFPPIVVARNSDYHFEKIEQERALLIQTLQQMAINEMRANGMPFDEETIKIKLEDIAKRIENLPDTLAADAQAVLEYIIDLNEVPKELRKGFYDWIVTKTVFHYKDVYNDKTCYESVSGLHLGYIKSPNIDFIEDGDAVRCRKLLSVNQMYDRFQDDPDFDKELEEFLEQASGESTHIDGRYYYSGTDIMTPTAEMFRAVTGSLPEEEYSDGIEVDHIQWRSFAQEGKLTRRNILTGATEIHYVDEDYIEAEGDEIEWKWVTQIWEAYCAGDKHWFGMRPVPIQRGSWEEPNRAKLLYNGRVYFARHTTPQSLVKKGLPYQKAVNSIKYRAEETLLKNLDSLILFPLGMIPKKEGWDEFKMFYYMRAFGTLFFDDTRPNAAAMISAIKNLDVSSYKHLVEAYNLVDIVKREYKQVCGINPQREAEVGVSAGKAVTQQAIDQSYVMSEENFLEYEEYERREYTGLAELGKFAFVDGIQSYYIRPDGTKGFLNLHDPTRFINSDLNVFVRNGAKESAKLELLRNQVQAFAQNQVDPKMINAIIQGDNFAELNKIMDEIDQRLEARRQQELQAQQEVQASKERIASQTLEFNYYSQDLASYTDIQVALIKEGMGISEQMRDMEEKGTAATDAQIYGTLRANLEKNALAVMQNATKLKEIASKERMNKENNETALKNKTSGEK